MVKTTIDFLDDIKEVKKVSSDYALAKILDTRHTNISHYRNGRSRFDGVMCIKVAKALSIEPAYVMACIEAERSKNEEVRKAWERAALVLSNKKAP